MPAPLEARPRPARGPLRPCARRGGYLLALAALMLLAARPGATAETQGSGLGAWTSYTVTEGLSRNWPYSLAQDGAGYLWTSTGILNRYDGRSFEQFPEGGTLYVDRAGALWVGLRDEWGLLRSEDGGRSFQRFGTAMGLPEAGIYAIREDSRGHLWVGTTGLNGGGRGVARFDGKRFTVFDKRQGLGGDDVVAIAEDREGRLWFGLSSYKSGLGHGVACFDPKSETFRNYTTADGLPSDEVSALAIGLDGTLYVGTMEGLCLLRDGRFVPLVTSDGIDAKLAVRSLLVSRVGHLWIGSRSMWTGKRYESRGVLQWDGSRTTIFDGGDLKQHDYRDILEDRDGNLWFATFAAGLLRLDLSMFRPTEVVEALRRGVLALRCDREGSTWLLAPGGRLVRHVPGENADGTGRFEVWGPEQGLPPGPLEGLTASRGGEIWVWTSRSAARLADGRFQVQLESPQAPLVHVGFGRDGGALLVTEAAVHRADGSVLRPVQLSGVTVAALLQSLRGPLYLTTDQGLFVVGDQGVRLYGRKDGLSRTELSENLFEDAQGRVYFSCRSGGIYVLEAPTWDRPTLLQGTERRGEAFYLDSRSRLWIGSWGHWSRGLESLDAGVSRTYTRADGLGDLDIQLITEDARGTLWIGTNGGGLSRFDGSAFQTLTIADGMASNNVRSVDFAADGGIWVSSLSGDLTRYQPRRTAPSVRVTELLADSAISAPRSVELTARRLREVQFHVQGLSFNVRPEAMRYVWKLEPLERDWQPATTQQVATYRNLAPGHYTFRVRAIDRDLNVNEVPVTVALQLSPPWYMKPHYIVPIGALLLGLVAAVLWITQQAVVHRREARRLREQLIEQEHREREALARKNAELERKSTELVHSYAELQKALEELKTAEAQLIHSEKMAALGTMVAGVAHEINNPVNFIHANLPVLQEYMDGFRQLVGAYEAGRSAEEIDELKAEIDYEFLLDDLDELIKGCKTGTDRIRRIVLDLRNFSRKDESELKPVDLREGIESSLTIAGSLFKGRITVHKDYGELPSVLCNPGQINQVVLNLLQNAADAIPSNGEIWIRTRAVGPEVELSVRDTGSGIPPEVLKKIFDPFFTTKPVGKGTGLGLSISMQIVEKHGGKLWAESQPGCGAVFYVRLPTRGRREALDAGETPKPGVGVGLGSARA